MGNHRGFCEFVKGRHLHDGCCSYPSGVDGKYELDPAYLEIEITESAYSQEYEKMRKMYDSFGNLDLRPVWILWFRIFFSEYA